MLSSRSIRRAILGATVLPFAVIAASVAQDDLVDPALEQQGEPLGWTVPLTPPAEDAVESELDRLSESASGVGFAAQIYDSKADNPLVPVSVTLRALDKITATYRDLDINIGEEQTFGALTILPRTCDKRPPEEVPETTVFLEVFATNQDVQGARTRASRGENEVPTVASSRASGVIASGSEPSALFRGWMFASSPSLNALEHPVYDVWVIDCTMMDPRT